MNKDSIELLMENFGSLDITKFSKIEGYSSFFAPFGYVSVVIDELKKKQLNDGFRVFHLDHQQYVHEIAAFEDISIANSSPPPMYDLLFFIRYDSSVLACIDFPDKSGFFWFRNESFGISLDLSIELDRAATHDANQLREIHGAVDLANSILRIVDRSGASVS